MSARVPVRFLVRSADAPGGVARSVLATAGGLAETYDVEVVSLFRRRNRPVHPVPPGVRMRYVRDHRGPMQDAVRRSRDPRLRVRHWLDSRPSRLIHPHDTLHATSSLWSDLRLVGALRGMRSGVLVTTRPSFLAAAARTAPRGLRIIAHEHMNYLTRPEQLRAAMGGAAERAAAVVVLTERDQHDWRAALGDVETPVHVIPNPVPWDVGHDGRTRQHVVLAAGRLATQKGFDRLIEAYRLVAERHPTWRVRIHGEGEQQDVLAQLIRRRSLDGVVELAGWTDHMQEALADASVLALSSRFEGLPMVLVEAMSRGLPVVAFDCPRGPREVVRDGVNGLLVPDGDIDAFARALDRLLGHDELRRRMGAEALRTAESYALPAVARQWRELIDGVVS